VNRFLSRCRITQHPSNHRVFVDAVTFHHDAPIDHACLTFKRTDRLVVESKRCPPVLLTPVGT
jgi:hypothetical protein